MKLSTTSLILLLSIPLLAYPRSYQAKKEFKLNNPCPVTHKPYGSCKGYVIDHIIPLCAGGPDIPSNMQWSEKKASYKKDVEERLICRKIKAGAIKTFKSKESFCKQISRYSLPHIKRSACN